MAIFVYRRSSSSGARELADALPGGVRVRRFEGGMFYRSRRDGAGLRPQAADLVVSWGEAGVGNPARVLNGAPIISKYQDAVNLRAAGVATIEVNRTQPPARPVAAPTAVADAARAIFVDAQEAAETFAELTYSRTPVLERTATELRDLFTRLHTALQTPLPLAAPAAAAAGDIWVPRLNDHVGGNDLLRPPTAAEFWVKREPIAHEYRVHVFDGRSIRAGRKVPREGMTPHAWIRSYDGGWKISYDGFESSTAMRQLAASAVAALNLDFGAVDIGQRPNGTLFVLEVNRAAGLEGGTVTAYATAIQRYLQEGGRESRAAARRAA